MILDAARQAYIKTKLPNRNMRYHMDSKPTGYGSPHRKTIWVLCWHPCALAAAAASIRASLAARGHQTLSKIKSVYQILSCSQLILSGLQLFS